MKYLNIEDLKTLLYKLDKWKEDNPACLDEEAEAARYRILMKKYNESIPTISLEDSVQEFIDAEWTIPCDLSNAADLIKADYPSTSRLLERIMEPTKKSPEIDQALTNLSGKSRKEAIDSRGCTTCDVEGLTYFSFKDELSIQEYKISGMCQDCQDSVFNVEMCEQCGNTVQESMMLSGLGFGAICPACYQQLILEYENDQFELNKYRG